MRNARLPDNLFHLHISLKQIHGFRTIVLFFPVSLCYLLCLRGLKAIDGGMTNCSALAQCGAGLLRNASRD